MKPMRLKDEHFLDCRRRDHRRLARQRVSGAARVRAWRRVHARTPLQSEMDECQDYLVRQIQIIQPKIICLLGSAAVKAVLGPTESISKIRGKWITKPVSYMDDDLYIMPMFHPSYLLRNPSKKHGAPKWLTWTDMKEVKGLMIVCE